VGSFVNYTLPILYDAEGQSVTITAKYQGTTVLPGFVSLNPTTRLIMMQPARGIDSGNYILDLTLSDGSLTSSYQLKIIVNLPAKFSQDLTD
jgi:hypothetical protein